MKDRLTAHAVLRASCILQKGIAAKLTQFVYDAGAEIIDYDHYVDIEKNYFYCRMEWTASLEEIEQDVLRARFRDKIAGPYRLDWDLRFKSRPLRLAVFVSYELAHLYVLLMKCLSRQWDARIEFIVSNHADLAPEAARFDVPYHHLPIDKNNKAVQEACQLALLKERQIDLIVFARYMQVVTETLIRPYENRIINIHHSMLPAFAGAKPYHQAHARGVKLIGATGHYVTLDLDAGPIIAQAVKTVDHRKSVADLVAVGRDLEVEVLARAVGLHIDSRVLVRDGRTIVFD
ncbi:MAG: formyltetrahydrofolate deformylase [Nitrospirae bacterium]|nr:formyltetrahydrofolate deformylase [Candidatus Manganitrophaceae bacterium]